MFEASRASIHTDVLVVDLAPVAEATVFQRLELHFVRGSVACFGGGLIGNMLGIGQQPHGPSLPGVWTVPSIITAHTVNIVLRAIWVPSPRVAPTQ